MNMIDFKTVILNDVSKRFYSKFYPLITLTFFNYLGGILCQL